MTFRMAVALMLTPDFTAVMQGRKTPPRTNHDAVDWPALRQVLLELFPYGPKQDVRVCNDTVDQVTLHTRAGMVTAAVHRAKKAGSVECEDFGKALVQQAAKQPDGVIDVRQAWTDFHCLTDRKFAPPPVLIPFIVETADFEDAMLWMSSAQVGLGLPSCQELMMRGVPPGANGVQLGKLPPSTKKKLEALFGCDFETEAQLMRLAVSRVPAAYKGLGLD